MTDPIKALSWEFFRRLLVTVPLTLPMMIIGPLGIEGLFWVAGLPMAGELIAALRWQILYLAMGFALMATPLVEAYKGLYQRIMTFPVSNKFIATWMMASAIVAVVGQELLIHWLYGFTLSDWSYRAIFGIQTSLLGPSQPVFATMVSLLMAMFWSLREFRFRKVLVCGLLLGILCFWIGGHYFTYGPSAGMKEWTSLSLSDATICVVVIAASWLVTWRGIARERCGDNVGHSFDDRAVVLSATIEEILFPDRVRIHKSPEAAITWSQWRYCGRNVALGGGFGLGALQGFIAYCVFGSRQAPEGIMTILFLIPGIVGLLTGSVLGSLAPPTNREGITMFLSAAPLSDVRLSRGLLWNAWRTTLIAWGLVTVAGLLACGAMIAWDGLTSVSVQIDHLNRSSKHSFGVMILPLAVLGSVLLAWMLTATLAVMHWTGNRLLPVFAIVGVLAHTILLSLLTFFLEQETITLLREVSMGIAALAIFIGSMWAFWTTFQRKMIEPGSAALLLSFWLVQSLLCWYFVPAPVLHRLFVIGILMLTVSPIAFAPLAISRNRHVA